MKKILITGASGFIGSALVDKALMLGYEVYAGVRASSNRQFLQHDKIHFFEADFSDRECLIRKLSQFVNAGNTFDYIVHNAGTTIARKRNDFIRVNYDNTNNFIGALKEANVIPQKFILVSSLATHGPGSENLLSPIQITDEQKPVSAYGKSKLMAEQSIINSKLFPYLILRPTAIYGPRDKDFLPMFKMINNNIELYIGNHTQLLSMLYVKDFAAAVFHAIESPLQNKSYFVSDGNQYDKKELGGIIRRALKRKTLLISIPKTLANVIAVTSEGTLGLFGRYPVFNRGKITEMAAANWTCDVTPIKCELNFIPEYDLEKGIVETVEWYKKNKWI